MGREPASFTRHTRHGIVETKSIVTIGIKRVVRIGIKVIIMLIIRIRERIRRVREARGKVRVMGIIVEGFVHLMMRLYGRRRRRRRVY